MPVLSANSFAASPVDPDMVYFGGMEVWSNPEADTNWTRVSQWGEYYTNVAELYAQVGNLGGTWSSITIPDDTALKKDFRWSTASLFNELSCSMYIEFDADVHTEAFRMIVLEVKEQDMSGLANQMNTDTVGIFASATTGSYISPVFDTE